ncbi:WD repeat-containing protein WDS-like [Vitis vinifera]|uniref:WD repeat-containing protein WDS-like n=1 Tax=Vitis vinifera TaxID=29760 RepID=A0A438F0X1_VITVI|nr:WD repeat-containing protein WDS-like [Vitis vinifera]
MELGCGRPLEMNGRDGDEGNQGSRGPHFSRHFNDWELGDVETLFQKLHPLVVKRDVEDTPSWNDSKNENFSVRSLYCSFSKGPRDPFMFSIMWKSWAPIKLASLFATEATSLTSPDGHWRAIWNNGGLFVFVSCPEPAGFATLWLSLVLENGVLILRHMLQSHQNPVSFVAWSPDDTMLLTCGNGEVLKLWDVETGTCKHTFGDHGFIVSSCAWFPDSKRIVCGSSDPEKGIYMWDCDGNEIKAWKGMRMPKVLDLAVTPDGENLISIFSEKEIRILNVGTNAEHVISEDYSITSLSVSRDSKFLIVNLNSEEIHMWDVAGKWEKPLKYTGHKQNKYVIRSCFGGFHCTFIASGSENSLQYPLKVDPFSKQYDYGIHPESNTLNLSHEMDDVENG